MVKITIDHREVEIPPGATILDAARKLDIDVPTLCFLKGYEPSTSCLICMVKVRGQGRLVPSCATAAVEGMEIESETEEVHQVRKTALELLLSDHVGDCQAPCRFACPAHMDVPLMLRQISADDLPKAIVTVKHDIALPAVLGRVCPKPCEKGCRRSSADGPVAVCELKRYVADADLASGDPYMPPCKPATGRRVAIVGAGPTGLSAAYHLLQEGHAATIFDDHPQPGGRLRYQTDADVLSPDVLDAEIAQILRLGPELRLETPVGDKPSLDDLCSRHDAVLIAVGGLPKDQIQRWGLEAGTHGIRVTRGTFETNRPGVFAAGNAIRAKGLVVRSVADGKEAAAVLDRYLAGLPVTGRQKPFSVRMGRLNPEELSEFVAGAGDAPRSDPSQGESGFILDHAVEQAGRCLHCDCRALDTCKLKRYAAMYGADPHRFKGPRAEFRQVTQHSSVIYEPGKCIDCALCVQIAAAAGEPLGLTFVGRGFDVRIGVPFNRSMAEALTKVAAQCVAVCPTAALSLKQEPHESELPILDNP